MSLGVGMAALSGCAPTIWDRPGTTPAQFAMDNARCRLMAEGANPDFGAPTIYTGSFKGDLAANAGAGLVHGLAQGVAVSHTHDLCMQANGYVARAPGGAQVSAPPMPAAISTTSSPAVIAASAPSSTTTATVSSTVGSPPMPAPPIAAPAPTGRVVLVPVTIFNEYHPHWTVDLE